MPTQDDAPLPDPEAVHSAYRAHRARRRARVEHRRRTRRAGIRFWLTWLLLVTGAVVLAVVIYREAQSLFGI